MMTKRARNLWLIVFGIGGLIMATLNISGKGLNILKRFEALRLTKYLDDAGKWSVGWGHVIKPWENLDTITLAKAESLLKSDVLVATSVINKNVKAPLNQNQFDALTAFVFNVGEYNFKISTLLKKLNAMDYQGAANEFSRWIYVTEPKTKTKVVSKGLVNRRAMERDLFLS